MNFTKCAPYNTIIVSLAQYFFNSHTKSYMYWDGATHTYIPVASGSTPSADDAPSAATPEQGQNKPDAPNTTTGESSAYVSNVPPEYSIVINENISTESGVCK